MRFLFYFQKGCIVGQYRQEIRRLIGLAFPILLAQVAQTAMTLVDTIMAGRYSAIDLAAISVASSFWLPIVLTSQGIIMALTPIVAQLNGAQKKAQIPHAVAQGLWLTALVFIPAGLLLYFSPLLLHWMDVSVLMAEKTEKPFSMFFFVICCFLKNICDLLVALRPGP